MAMPVDSSTAAEFDRLFRQHVPVLFRYACRWTGSVDRAEDLVQELLTRLFPRLAEIRSVERLRPWAVRVMYRIFVDGLRRERRSPVQFVGRAGTRGSVEGDEEEEEEEFPDLSAEPSDLADRQLTQERIVAAWAALSEEHRVVLSMHDIEGYSLEELAGVMDLPLGTMKSRLHRARQRLRGILTGGTISPSETCTSMKVPDRAERG